jgi:L-alanine-DL-glutamate epimerase-like enolase superfamily enzyme
MPVIPVKFVPRVCGARWPCTLRAMSRATGITSVDAYPLNVPLLRPFVIATGRLEQVENVAVRVQLSDGAEGWGEVPSLQPVTVEDQPTALTSVGEAAEWVVGRDAAEWRPLAADLASRVPRLAAVRAGIEMAVIDAFTRSLGVPLYHFFGGAERQLTTDITIPICDPDEARSLAAQYRKRGFTTIKTKVGLDVDADIARLAAIRESHPDCALVLDANEGYSAEQALDALRALRVAGLEPALFEQPVPRDDWAGLGRVTREGGVPVAADESCRTPQDALRIAQEQLAPVLNIKLAKAGVVAAIEIAAIARAAGLGLMIGGMVETRLGMGFSAHLAAGLGGFEWIDLDTPLLMSPDPVVGGYEADGAVYDVVGVAAGHGGTIDVG